jgi:hypothetical protein
MADPSVRDLLSESGLAFTATVERAGASSLPGLPTDERTVIARVGEVLHAPPQVDLAPGATVTIQLSPELPPLTPGTESTFFANAVAYGDELAVAEVGRTSTEDAAAPTARLAGVPSGVTPVRAAVAELAQQAVVDHARTADAVIRAQVVALRMVPPSGPPQEHDPHWWIATLRADRVAKSDIAPGDDVEVLYANSLDIKIRERPKPKAGQGGLWLLHRTADPALAQQAPYELLDPLDLQDSIMLDVLDEAGLQ